MPEFEAVGIIGFWKCEMNWQKCQHYREKNTAPSDFPWRCQLLPQMILASLPSARQHPQEIVHVHSVLERFTPVNEHHRNFIGVLPA